MAGRQQNSTTGRRKGKDTTLSSRLAAACSYKELQLITEHAGLAIRRPEKCHVSSLLRENDRRLSIPARARGYSRREHITRGNTSSVAGDMCSGEQKIRYLAVAKIMLIDRGYSILCIHVV